MRNTATFKALQACLSTCLRKQVLKHVPQIACCVRSQGDDWARASARYTALGRKLLLKQLMEVPDEGTPVKRERSEGGQGRAFRPTTSSMPIGRSRARTPQRAAQMEDEPVTSYPPRGGEASAWRWGCSPCVRNCRSRPGCLVRV